MVSGNKQTVWSGVATLHGGKNLDGFVKSQNILHSSSNNSLSNLRRQQFYDSQKKNIIVAATFKPAAGKRCQVIENKTLLLNANTTRFT